MALAWLYLALASENPSQSQSQQSWPGLVWLWLEPWLEFGNADPFPTSRKVEDFLPLFKILTFFVQKGMSRFGRAQSEPRRMTPEYDSEIGSYTEFFTAKLAIPLRQVQAMASWPGLASEM
ncbi:hypothetical protein C8R43DRAFT_959811 [Mycena crocata]|nr:hypothetical protein C8R43DRAFT_959811 [Mycena crocata]